MSDQMTNEATFRKDAAETLEQIEKQHDVASLMYRGFHVWPIIRARIGRSYENLVLGPRRKIAANLSDTAEYRRELNDHFAHVTSRRREELSLIGSAEEWKKGPIVPHHFIKNQDLNHKTDVLFATRSGRNYQVKNGAFHSQEDYLLTRLKENLNCVKLEPIDKESVYRTPRWEKTLQYQTPWENLERNFSQKHFKILGDHLPGQAERWPDREKLIDILKTLKGVKWIHPNAIDIAQIERSLAFIDSCSILCEKWLTTFNPKIIFGNLYNDVPTMALMLAASRVGIPFVEIINGAMGNYHWHYTHWYNMPDDGYETFPDYIWVWDEESQKSVENHFRPDYTRHKAIIGGNCRLEYWLSQDGKAELPLGQSSFLEALKPLPFVILVTHQYIDLLPDLLLETIKRSPKSWTWLLRLHPQSLSLKQVYIDTFQAHSFTNVIVEEATSAPLFDLLSNVDHLLTGFSTTAIEATSFKVDITLTGEVGKEIFSDYIDGNRMAHIVSIDDLFDRLSLCAEKRKSNAGLMRGPRRVEPQKPELLVAEILEDWQTKHQVQAKTQARLKNAQVHNLDEIENLFDVPDQIPIVPEKMKKSLKKRARNILKKLLSA